MCLHVQSREGGFVGLGVYASDDDGARVPLEFTVQQTNKAGLYMTVL